MAAPILIVTGPPGVGKSTAARDVAAAFARSAVVAGDEFFRALASGAIPPHLPEAHDQNVALIDITMEATVGYAAAGWTTVLEGIFGPWFLDPVRRAAAGVDADLHYAVLWADLPTCVTRFVGREGTRERTEIVEAMHAQFESHAMPAHTVDASGDPTAVAAVLVDRVRAGDLRL